MEKIITPATFPTNHFTRQYMADLKVKLGIESDYALAKALRVSKTTVSNYRHGLSAFSPAVCHRVASILGVHSSIVVSSAELDRNSGKQEEYDTWQWIRKATMQVYGAAAHSAVFVLAIVLVALCAVSMPASAANSSNNAPSPVYIMLSYLRMIHRWLSGLTVIMIRTATNPAISHAF